MTCEQIRESLDAVNIGEAGAQHMKGCATCSKETAATAKLVSLLHAQPQVKAPADFMARLQMRMATETVHDTAWENAQLKSLLQAVPAVTAPSDFSFRVRARLAQQQAQERQRNPLVWLQNWFAQSFSFGQAATAMAAIALIAVFTTMQLRHGVSSPDAAKPDASGFVATTNAVPQTPVAIDEAAVTPAPVKVVRAARSSSAPVRATIKESLAKPTSDIARALPTEMAEPAMYSPTSKRTVSNRDRYFGRELTPVLAVQKTESVISAF